MKKTMKFFALALLLFPANAMAQNVTYTFDTGGNGENTSGTTYTNLVPYGATIAGNFSTGLLTTNYGLATDLGNLTKVFNGNAWAGTNMGGVDLTAFTGTGDQQVDWTMYIKTATTATKGNGVLLRAQNTASGYSTGVRQGYHFTCYGSGTSGSVKFRVGKLDGTASYVNIQAEVTLPISGFTSGPLYLRAKAVGSLLYFEYSTNGTDYANFPGSPYYDTTFPTANSTNGTVQLVWGLGGGTTMDQYFDNVVLSSNVVTLSGTKFSYTGSAQSPTINKSGFTGAATESKTYKGLGGTSYGPTSTAPTAPGTYILTASETESSATKSATISFDILPTTFDQVYTFNSDSPGSTAASTTCVTSALNYKHLVQRFGNNVLIGSNLYPTNSNMLSPNGSNEKALTTLDNFGSTATDYSVTWKMYFTNATGNKHLVFLRANNISLSGTNILGGTAYEFYVQMQTGTSSVNAYIYKLAAGGGYTSGTLLGSNTATLAQSQNYQNRAMWFRASSIGSSSVLVKLEYSTDGSTWSTLCSGADASSPYASGSTQLTGINSNNMNYFFDYFGYTDLTKNVTLTGNKFVYDGTSKSPTINVTGMSSPTETKTYTGIGSTNYAASSTAPSAPGTYNLTVTEVSGAVSRSASQAFEILSSEIDIAYTFNSDAIAGYPANTTYSGFGHKVQAFSGTVNGYATTGNTIQPQDATSLTELTSFGTTSNSSVIWKEYITATGIKKGVILRASGTAWSSGTLYGAGYLFYVYNNATNLQLDIRKINASPTAPNTLVSTTSLSNPAISGAIWYKATVNGTALKFEYSTDGVTWVQALTTTDATYSSGTTQVTGINGAGTSYYYDYFGLKDLSKNVTANDSKFVYNGSANGPTIAYPGFTSPSTTLTYTGTGVTSYGASSTAPSAVGTYSVAVSASENGVTRTGTFGFEIVPATFDNLYTFKTDVVGNAPANVVFPTSQAANGSGVVTSYSGSENGAGSTALAFQPLTGGSVNGTGVANLTSIASSSNYSITWKEYITGNGFKKGFLLQGQSGTCAYANDLKQGYMFIVWNDATVGTKCRIYTIGSTGTLNYPAENADNAITNPAAGAAMWYRATVAYGLQKFEYSTNGTNWNTAVTTNDVTYGGLPGTTQVVFGLGSTPVGGYYYNYIATNGYASVFSKNGSSAWSTATEWSKAPTSTNDLILESGEMVVDQNSTVNAVIVKPGAKLTLNSGKTLTSKIKLVSDATATGTFVNQGGTLTSTSATIQQYVTTGRNWYVSSPVSNATSAVFSAASSSTNKLYVYDETTNTWPQISDNTTSLTPVKGYVANLPSSGTISFTGTINDGNQSIALSRTSGSFAGFNLVGNPYPSFLDWKLAAAANSGVTSSIWYRTKTAADAYTFDTYNATADLGTSNGVKTVTKLIPPMQAFWVYVNAASTLSLTNAMRFHEDVSENRLKSANVANVNVLRLNVDNGVNSDEAIVFDNQNALNGIDGYDSPKMPATAGVVPQLSSMVDGSAMSINGMQSLSDQEVTLNFITGVKGSFTIRLNAASTVESDRRVLLKDKRTNVEFDLTEGNAYSFSSDAVTNDSRFSLVLKTATALLDLPKNAGFLLYEQSGQQILEHSAKLAEDASVTVYNAVGQKLMNQKLTGQRTKLNLPEAAGVLILKVRNAGVTTVLKTTTH